MEARFVRSAKIIEEMGAAKTTKEKLLSTGLVIDAEKERYRLLTGRSIWKTASEPESLQKAKQLRILQFSPNHRQIPWLCEHIWDY